MYCHRCGRQVPTDALFCPFCGQQLVTSPPPPITPVSSIPPPPVRPTAPEARPLSITLAAILYYIFGALGILGGLGVMAIGGLVGVSGGWIPFIGGLIGVIAGAGIFLGFIILVVGALDVVAGSWLMKSLRKGGILGITLSIIDIVFSAATIFILPFAIIGILIDIVLVILIAVGWNTLR